MTGVLLIAAHIDGAITLNPQAADFKIQQENILYCLAEDILQLSSLSKDNNCSVSSWIGQFQTNRREGSFKHRQHGKHVHMRSAKVKKA